MINLLRNLQLNKYFLSAIFVFAYLQSIHTRIGLNHPITFLTFTPEAAVTSFISACIIFLVVDKVIRSHDQQVQRLDIRHMLKMLFISVIICVCIFNIISLLVSLAFSTISRNYVWPVFIHNNLNVLLDVCIYGSFYLVYWYYQKSKIVSLQVAAHHQAMAENKIAQLKSQLNPHFLFNNLNILDQLIEEDQKIASLFLNDFAELYRYSLQTSGSNLVLLIDEIQFACNYFRLMEHKYGSSYSLVIDQPIYASCDKFIPPFTLQLLLENAIEHNLGTVQHPVDIRITIEGDNLIIINSRVKNIKKKKREGGRSLENLQQQYAILTHKKIQLQDTETEFRMQLPLIEFQ
jgi:sensor histidine kinase YesM